MKPLVVIKFGTASITRPGGEIDESVVVEIARQVARLREQYRIVLVSSGAVGAGKAFIRNYQGDISQRKAAAAVGNPLLIGLYARYFGAYGVAVAQSLCERGHFANRQQFLQLKQTYEALWESGIIPIANENDVVSDLELKFSDNDELATLLAAGFGAEWLLFSTSVGGLLGPDGQVIPSVERVDETVLSLADTSTSAVGLGGMVSKLSFAKRAVRLGIRVVIFGIHTPDGILQALAGQAGTRFAPEPVSLNARRRWLGTGSLIAGQIRADAGAVAALRHRRSLLAVGIRQIEGEFDKGEVMEILDESGSLVAVAKARVSSAELRQNLSTQNFAAAHANDVVLV